MSWHDDTVSEWDGCSAQVRNTCQAASASLKLACNNGSDDKPRRQGERVMEIAKGHDPRLALRHARHLLESGHPLPADLLDPLVTRSW